MKVIRQFHDLVGESLKEVKTSLRAPSVDFILTDGRRFQLNHVQDCCEDVYVEDITGDLNDLVGKIFLADENSKEASDADSSDSATWTFYRIATAKGAVVIRFIGISNGCYSEKVDFEEV
jgi:hypothetical protein